MKLSQISGMAFLLVSGLACQRVAEPPPVPPAGMVLVPAGECLLGSNDPEVDEERRPERRRFLPGFFIDRTEVTNAQFQRFRPAHHFLKGEENLPAAEVTYAEAEAYAAWAGKRLPTEDEWEKAARGTDGRTFPWGSTWDPKKVATRSPKAGKHPACGGPSRLRPVGSVPAGASPYGCLDLAGNAWEWVQGHPNGNLDQRILRGGAVGYGARACQTFERSIEGTGAT